MKNFMDQVNIKAVVITAIVLFMLWGGEYASAVSQYVFPTIIVYLLVNLFTRGKKNKIEPK